MSLQEEALRLRNDGKTVKEIASILGKGERTIQRYLSNLGATKGSDRPDVTNEAVLSLYDAGYTIVEIAKHFNCSHDTVTKRLSSQGVSNSRKDGILRHFERTHGNLWSDIKVDLDSGKRPSSLAAKYHVRYDIIFRLMEKNNYVREVPNVPLLELDAHISDVLSKEPSVSRTSELSYLNAIRSCYVRDGLRPRMDTLMSEVGHNASSSYAAVKKYDLQRFLDLRPIGSAAAHFMEFLNSLGVYYRVNDRTVLRDERGYVKELDFYIPSMNLGIEINPTGTHSVDSVGYFRDDNIDVCYHQKKSLLAEEAGIGLVHVFDNDFFDERRFCVIKNRISCMVSNRIVVGARKCEVRELESEDASCFLEKYHLQGSEKSAFCRLGLYLGDMLVSVMCFGRSRFTKDECELIRYCCHPGYSVSGCFGKLFSHFLRTIGRSVNIVSYMDMSHRFSVHNVYEQNGFSLEGITRPDYYWSSKYGDKWFFRYDVTKRKLVEQGYPDDKTEVETMRSRGYFRVYGAGSKRYVYRHVV